MGFSLYHEVGFQVLETVSTVLVTVADVIVEPNLLSASNAL
ncbi:hypothetical protein ACB092_04G077900 [Castanea dentata]